jgi:hypothetical protein
MSKPSVAGGLCLACKFDPDCIYEGRSDDAILQCEQFEMGFRQFPAPAGPISSALPRARKPNAYPGLCANCENREICIYPKPEGGVWRCEEYA